MTIQFLVTFEVSPKDPALTLDAPLQERIRTTLEEGVCDAIRGYSESLLEDGQSPDLDTLVEREYTGIESYPVVAPFQTPTPDPQTQCPQ